METDFATQLRELGYRIEDIVETFARSGGPGGQNVNKVSTQVTLRHIPSGLQIIASDHTSQLMNRRVARERMIAAIISQRDAVAAGQKQEREKKRRQTRPKPRALKEKILKGKKQRSEVKKTRGRVRD